eukprot:1993382-Pleurochrysis_carterae.AAC.1
MPALVSPSHIVLAPEAAIVGIDCMTEVKIACVSVSPRTCAKWSLKAASPRVMSATRMKSTLHTMNPCGNCRLTSAARASPRPRALKPSLTAWYAPLMRTCVDGCDAVITIIAITMYVVSGGTLSSGVWRRRRSLWIFRRSG